jgi:DNA repair exonuclease SbcCD ATPase subunit
MDNLTIVRVEAEKFASYNAFDIALPATGLTLVLGTNGSGKSSIVEAIAWALYGKTLRGALPAIGARVAVTLADGTRVERRRIPKAYQLSLEAGGKDLSGQTTTETQGRVDALLGPWERFAPTRLFARDFMAKFAASTDKERKTLIEDILGLQRFDIALRNTREQLKASSADFARATDKAGLLAQYVQAQTELVSQLGDPNELDLLNESLATAEAKWRNETEALDVARKDSADADELLTALQKRRAVAEVKKQVAQRNIAELAAKSARLADLETCPVCLQAVEAHAHAAITQHLVDAAAPFELQRTEAVTVLTDIDSQHDELLEEREIFRAQEQAIRIGMAMAQSKVSELKGQITSVSQQYKARVDAKSSLLKYEYDLAETNKAKAIHETNINVLARAVDVFGLQGARVLLMGRALIALERETNAILQALGLGIGVVLKTTSVRKTGKEVDELSVLLTGAGGGEYGAASSGERARVDVALMLGLAALLGGRGDGYMAFDEVFDTLDEEGIERVSAFLSRMSEHRQVIVISHHAELRSQFPRGLVFQATKSDGVSTIAPR